MGNRKAKEKLRVPAWFNLLSYRATRKMDEPIQWLEQFAFRIDLMLLWKELASIPSTFSADTQSICVDQFYLDEMLSLLQANLIVSVNDVTSEYGPQGINFPTLELVRNGFDPVRPMTFQDLYLGEASLYPAARHWARSYFERIANALPYPEEELILASLVEDETQCDTNAPEMSESPRQRVLREYRSRLADGLRQQILYEPPPFDYLTEAKFAMGGPFFEDKSTEGAPAYFVVEPTVSYSVAEASFKKHYEKIRARTVNSKRFSSLVFATWCDDGVLPYIDLKMFETMESAKRQNVKLAILEEDLTSAIYRESAGRSSTCVSDTTRPLAESLMDVNSPRFRMLLVEAYQRGDRLE